MDEPPLEHFEQQLLVGGKEAVFVLTQQAGDVVELRIVAEAAHRRLAQRLHLGAEIVEIAGEDTVLKPLRLVLDLLKAVEVLCDQLLKEVEQEAPDAGGGAAPLLDEALEDREQLAVVAHEDDPLWADEVAAVQTAAAGCAVRHDERSADAVGAQLRLADSCVSGGRRVVNDLFESGDLVCVRQLLGA